MEGEEEGLLLLALERGARVGQPGKEEEEEEAVVGGGMRIGRQEEAVGGTRTWWRGSRTPCLVYYVVNDVCELCCVAFMHCLASETQAKLAALQRGGA